MSVRLMRALGGAPDSAFLSDFNYINVRVSPTNATSGIRVGVDGNVYQITSSGYTYKYPWRTGPKTAGNYQVKWVSDPANSLSSGSEDTWAVISVDRDFYVTFTSDAGGSKVCDGTLYIRQANAPNTVLAIADGRMEATVSP